MSAADLPLSFILCCGLIGFALFAAGYIVGVSSVIEEEARDER
jgi:hypothetical protein